MRRIEIPATLPLRADIRRPASCLAARGCISAGPAPGSQAAHLPGRGQRGQGRKVARPRRVRRWFMKCQKWCCMPMDQALNFGFAPDDG